MKLYPLMEKFEHIFAQVGHSKTDLISTEIDFHFL
jgi:hypothetical protein